MNLTFRYLGRHLDPDRPFPSLRPKQDWYPHGRFTAPFGELELRVPPKPRIMDVRVDRNMLHMSVDIRVRFNNGVGVGYSARQEDIYQDRLEFMGRLTDVVVREARKHFEPDAQQIYQDLLAHASVIVS